MSELFEPAYLQSNSRKGKCARCRAEVEPGKGFIEPPRARVVNVRGDWARDPWTVYCGACGEARKREINKARADSPVGIPCWQGGSVRFHWIDGELKADEVNIHVTSAEGVVSVKGYRWDDAALEIGRKVLENRKQMILDRAEGKKDW